MLTGVLLENDQEGGPVFTRDEEQFSNEGLTDDNWKNHLLLEEPFGNMLTAQVHVCSDSVSCTGPGALGPTSASTLEK